MRQHPNLILAQSQFKVLIPWKIAQPTSALFLFRVPKVPGNDHSTPTEGRDAVTIILGDGLLGV